jgi:hypothetical protein
VLAAFTSRGAVECWCCSGDTRVIVGDAFDFALVLAVVDALAALAALAAAADVVVVARAGLVGARVPFFGRGIVVLGYSRAARLVVG